MFTSGSPPVPETPYYGYLLASVLAQPHALLSAMITADPTDILAYQSRQAGGQQAVAFINTNSSSSEQVSFHPDERLSGLLQTWTYSAGTQNATNSNIVKGTRSAASLAHGITLPAESMVILESS
jgi:hypothetical protein